MVQERTQEEIKEKGFSMMGGRPSDDAYSPETSFERLAVGLKVLDSPITNINFYETANPQATKEKIIKAVADNNLAEMRAASQFFYRASGIYSRLCRYMAYLYRYDWFVTPIILDETIEVDKILEGFHKSLTYLDNFNAKKVFGELALEVLKDGVYYGYRVKQANKVVLQDLPEAYCRSRFAIGGKPAVEFNMKYFDDAFRDTALRLKILSVFPPEFTEGYVAYKQGKLPAAFAGDGQGWYMLDINKTVKLNMHGSDAPSLVQVIPAIIDLEEAKELDKRKMQQQLMKVIVQTMPLDKNGELIFDIDEAKALHNNAVAMLGEAIGVDVLTTFAKVAVEDLSERSSVATMDELGKVERGVFNEAGVSQGQFNTDGNLALEKSIANDEASMFGLVLQFEILLNEILAPFNKKPKRLQYRAQMLNTTIYNYQALAKLYKEQMQLGFSKMLPQIALGQSQSSILSTAYFENEILNLNELFAPPAMSSTTPGDTKDSGDGPGRPEKPADEQSDKTRRNKEAMS